MRSHDEMPEGRDTERMARVLAQFETQSHRTTPVESAFANRAQDMIEVACELAPAVRRRFARGKSL